MRKVLLLAAFFAVALALAVLPIASQAADQTWIDTNANNNWNTTDPNWNPGAVGWTQSNSAIFGGTGETVTLTEAITANGLTFNVGGYTITGNTLTFGGTPTIAMGANSAAINSALNTGGLNVVKSGAGTLTLGSTTAMVGGGSIEVAGGQLTLGANRVNLGTTQLIIDAGQKLLITFGNGVTGGSIKLGAGSLFGLQNGGSPSPTVASNIVLNSGSGAANAAQIGGFFFGNNTNLTGTISGSGDLRWVNNILGGGTNAANLTAGSNTTGWAANSYVGNTSFEGTNLNFNLTSNANNSTVTPFGTGTATANGGATLHFNQTGAAGNTTIITNALNLAAATGQTTTFFREDGNLRMTGTLDVSTTGTGKVVVKSRWGGDVKRLNLEGALTGSGNLTVTRTNDGEVGAVALLNTANTYNGTITVDNTGGAGGYLVLGANGSATNASVNLASSGAHLRVGGNNVTIASLTGIAGTNISGQTAVSGGSSLNVNQAGTTTYAGVIGGVGPTGGSTNITTSTSALSLVKNGIGTLALTGVNVYTGNTTISGGTLDITATGSKLYNAGYNNTSVVTIGTGANLKLDTFTYDGSLGKLADYRQRRVIDGGKIEVTGATHASGNDFTVNAVGGTFHYNPTVTSDTLTLAGNVNTNIQLDGPLTFQTTGNILVGEVLEGAGGLVKTGGNTLTLNGANLYAGTTSVSFGTLLVNGTHTGGAAYTVDSSAVLGGIGSTTSSVTVNGTFAPGASIESLATGGLTFNGGSTFAYELDSSSLNGDLSVASGGLSITGSPTLSLSELASGTLAPGSKLTLINYSGAWDNGTFASFADDSTFTLGSNQWRIDYNDTAGGTNFSGEQTLANFVTITVVPEPSTFAMLLFGSALLWVVRRKRS